MMRGIMILAHRRIRSVLMHQMLLAWKRLSEGLEAQERSGFDDIHRLLKGLPVPVTKAIRLMTQALAIEAQFLPSMTEEEQKRFTPSELLLYKHALEYKFKVKEVFDSIYTEYIPFYTQHIYSNP
jgi:hypothetical protein